MVMLILVGMKHYFLTKAIQHGPEEEIIGVVGQTLEIQEIPDNITVKGQIFKSKMLQMSTSLPFG